MTLAWHVERAGDGRFMGHGQTPREALADLLARIKERSDAMRTDVERLDDEYERARRELEPELGRLAD